MNSTTAKHKKTQANITLPKISFLPRIGLDGDGFRLRHRDWQHHHKPHPHPNPPLEREGNPSQTTSGRSSEKLKAITIPTPLDSRLRGNDLSNPLSRGRERARVREAQQEQSTRKLKQTSHHRKPLPFQGGKQRWDGFRLRHDLYQHHHKPIPTLTLPLKEREIHRVQPVVANPSS